MRSRLRGLSVRIRLLAGVLVLTTAGLLVANAGAALLLKSNLTERIDQDLAANQERLAQAEEALDGQLPPAGNELPRGLTSSALVGGWVVEYRDAAGQLRRRVPDGAAAYPDLTGVDLAGAAGQPFDTPAADPDPGAGFRVLVRELPGGRGTVTIGYDLTARDATIRRQMRTGILLTGLVAVLVGVLGSVVVRIGLRPLARVERTAEAIITGGDLSRRVGAGGGTEAGRLSATFDAMLETIERSFRGQAASEERLRRFVADASHELRTPVTGIRGLAEMYRRGAVSDPGEVPRIMARIEAEATRMSTLVSDLLLLARLDQERPLERQPVDLLVVAADAVHDAQVIDPGRPIELEIVPAGGGDEDEPGPVVLGDEARLRQVATNLVTNALTHTPSGTPVTVRAGLAGGRTAVLEVADRGPGLAPEHGERVFERFFRADRSRHRPDGAERTAGTGLGLSIVEAIVSAHAGTVAYHPTPGGGATFRVELPLGPSAG